MKYSNIIISILAIMIICTIAMLVDKYVLAVMINICIWSMLAASLGLILGYCGQLSLGHIYFWGCGAYATALLQMYFGLNFWLTFPMSVIAVGILALLVGYPLLRLEGPYFAIATLGLGEILRQVFLNERAITKGSRGISQIPFPDPIMFGNFFSINFDSRLSQFYLVFAFLIITIVLIYRIVNSRVGRAFIAIKENPNLAKSLGINMAKYKRLAFVISSMFAAVAGVLYAHTVNFIDPSASFNVNETFNLVIMVVFGGVGSIAGPILGAVVLTIIPEFLRGLAEYRLIIYGLMLLIVIIYLPKGIYGSAKTFIIDKSLVTRIKTWLNLGVK